MTHIAPTWLERLLGVNAEPGEGTLWRIDLAWPWPPWVTLLVAAVAVGFVVTVYYRETRQATRRYRMALAVLRLAILGLLLLMIAQVSLCLQRTGLPTAAVLIDDSLSMTVVDHYADDASRAAVERLQGGGPLPSRWSLLERLVAEDDGALLHGIAEGHRLRAYYLTGDRSGRGHDVPGILRELRSTTANGDSTRLGASIRTVLDNLRGASPAAVVALTDGINTDGPSLGEAAEYARRRNVPLYFIGLGSSQPVRDLKLFDLMADDVVFVDDIVTFDCKLSGAGFEGQKVSVVLRERDKPATDANVLAKTEVTLPADDRPRQVRLQFRPTKVGRFDYVVEAQPLPGEALTENNRQTCTIEVRKEKIRVLLVQAYPSYEFRYLRNMLARDETISLRTVLQDADPEHASQDATSLRTFPLGRDELFAYDVVILGDANPALLGSAALKNLANFVDQPAKGGALVMIAGPSFMPAAFAETPLARLLPFAVDRVRLPGEMLSDGFIVQPTELGLAEPSLQLGDNPVETAQIWRHLPPLYWLLEVPELKPGVRVLAEHPTRLGPDGRRLPVICFQYVGAGKVLFHATDETWRWRWRVGDLYFARYWIQTIRYLCRSKLREAGRPAVLSADRREYTQGDSVRLRVRFADDRPAPAADDGVTVVVEQSGGKTQRVALRRTAAGRGVFEALLDRPAVGGYHVWLAAPAMEGQAPAADFTVLPPPGEFAEVRMDAAAMRRAAEISGGRYYTFDNADSLLRDLPSGHPVPIESLPPRPLWNRWPVLATFLGLLVAEWTLRKRRGMV